MTQRLIQGWLLPENASFYRFDTNSIVIESLGIVINSSLGYASNRNNRIESSAELISSGLFLLLDIDKTFRDSLENDIEQLPQFIKKLNSDDNFYVAYYRKLLDIVKHDAITSSADYINPFICDTFEFKRWQNEAGIESTGITLINGWLHPLAELTKNDGKDCICAWGFASVMVAVACGRYPEKANQERAINILIREGVINIENSTMHLEVCRYLDSEYLQVLSKFKHKLDSRAKL